MYDSYAPVYDCVGQGAWSVRMATWTLDWLHAHNIVVRSVADFGCGTGAAAQVFRVNGLQVIGIDSSDAMLRIARERSPDSAWLYDDIRMVELPTPVDLVVSFYDTLNYLVQYGDLVAAWQRIAHALVPGGHAVADVNTVQTYASEWNEQDTIIADTNDVFVFNQLHFDALQRLGTGRIVWFVRDGDDWSKREETHQQRAHTDDEMRTAITAAGLMLIDRRTPTGDVPDEGATRVIYIARKA